MKEVFISVIILSTHEYLEKLHWFMATIANSVRYLMPQEMKLNMSGRQDLHEQLIFLIREDQNF